MTEDKIRSEVILRLAEAIEMEDQLDKIEAGSRLQEDLGLDSLQSVNLVLELENVFDIEIDDEEIEGLATVDDVVRLVEAKKMESA